MDENEALMEERNWLQDVIGDYYDVTITDCGLGMGQADLAYERDAGGGLRRRVSLTVRIEGGK
jgi:hypothetical protein